MKMISHLICILTLQHIPPIIASIKDLISVLIFSSNNFTYDLPNLAKDSNSLEVFKSIIKL